MNLHFKRGNSNIYCRSQRGWSIRNFAPFNTT